MTSGNANERTKSVFFKHPVATYLCNGGRDKSAGKRLLLDEFLREFGSRNLQTQALFFCNILNLHSPLFVDFCPSTCSISSASGDLSGYKGDLEINSVAQFSYNLILLRATELKFKTNLISLAKPIQTTII